MSSGSRIWIKRKVCIVYHFSFLALLGLIAFYWPKVLIESLLELHKGKKWSGWNAKMVNKHNCSRLSAMSDGSQRSIVV